MKALFIVNENAGRGKTGKRWPKLQENLLHSGILYDCYVTSRPKEATEVAKQAAKNQYTHVFAVGGDGTVNEVVNGVVGNNTVFGVLPTGTGNDFARMLRVPQNPAWLRGLPEKKQKAVDLMEVDGTFIAGAIGIGFDGAVAADINRASWKKRAGTFGYVLSMLKLIVTFKPFTLNLEIDGEAVFFRNCWLAAVGNGQFYGGGMRICPAAMHDDGELDIVVVHNLSRVGVLSIFPKVFTGNHIHHPQVECFRGKTVRVLTDPAVPMHGDGETLGNTPCEIRIRPQSINVICQEG